MDAWVRIHISHHAYKRYLLRVDAACENANIPLRQMWNYGKEACMSDLSLYGATLKMGYQYRIAEANNTYYLLVACDGVLITLLEPRVARRRLKVIFPKRFKQKRGTHRVD